MLVASYVSQTWLPIDVCLHPWAEQNDRCLYIDIEKWRAISSLARVPASSAKEWVGVAFHLVPASEDGVLRP